MILEGIVTTLNANGTVNVAPMGPRVDPTDFARPNTIILKPFKTSTTFHNLLHRPEGVVHVTDDVLLLAQAAIGTANPPMAPSTTVATPRLADCCRYHEFKIDAIDESSDRATLRARVVHTASVRDFFGLNRAKHAVVEAAILATRINFLDSKELADSLARLMPLVEKTAGPQEQAAFALLSQYIADQCDPLRSNRT